MQNQVSQNHPRGRAPVYSRYQTRKLTCCPGFQNLPYRLVANKGAETECDQDERLDCSIRNARLSFLLKNASEASNCCVLSEINAATGAAEFLNIETLNTFCCPVLPAGLYCLGDILIGISNHSLQSNWNWLSHARRLKVSIRIFGQKFEMFSIAQVWDECTNLFFFF